MPIKSNLVLPGFTNELFEQHQVVILFISSESLVAAVGNDKNILESPTYDSIPVDFIFVEAANFQMELARLCHILVPKTRFGVFHTVKRA